jgi:hypothetical protein
VHRDIQHRPWTNKDKASSEEFWYILPCSPLKVNRRFGRIYNLHLYGRWIDQSRNHPLPGWFLARLILRPWRWNRRVIPKCLLLFNGLHGVISQKIVLFIITAVRTSYPTQRHEEVCCYVSCVFAAGKWRAGHMLHAWTSFFRELNAVINCHLMICADFRMMENFRNSEACSYKSFTDGQPTIC